MGNLLQAFFIKAISSYTSRKEVNDLLMEKYISVFVPQKCFSIL